MMAIHLFLLLSYLFAPTTALASNEPVLHLTLDDALKLSLEKNLDIRLSSLSVPEKEAGLIKANGDFDWALSSSYTLDDSRTPSSSNLDGVDSSAFLRTRTRSYSLALNKKLALTGTELQLPYSYPVVESNSSYQRISTTHSPSLTLKVTQPLTQLIYPGYFSKKLTEAEYDLAIAVGKHKDKAIATITKTIETYLDTIKESESLKLKETSFALSKQTHLFVKEKYRIGKSSGIDLLDAESAMEQNHEAMLSAKTSLENKQSELALQVLAEPNKIIEVDTSLTYGAIQLKDSDLGTLIQDAISNRVEAIWSQAAIQKAAATKDAASIDRLPKLSVKTDVSWASLNRDLSSSHEELVNRKFQSWSAEADLEHPILMYASRGANRIAELKLSQEEIKLRQIQRDIALEVRKTFRQVNNSLERISALQKAVNAENEKYKGQTAKFRIGKISAYDLTLAQKSRDTAAIELLKAKIDYKKALYKFAESRGLLFTELGLVMDKDNESASHHSAVNSTSDHAGD